MPCRERVFIAVMTWLCYTVLRLFSVRTVLGILSFLPLAEKMNSGKRMFRMDEYYKRQKTGNLIRILALVLLAVTIFGSMYAAHKGIISGVAYYIIMGVGLFLFWLLLDVISPRITHSFEDKTPEQISAFQKYALLELAGYAGIGFFAVSINGSAGIYGALVFVFSMMFKRRFLNVFLGLEEDGSEKEQSDSESTDDETAGSESAGGEITDRENTGDETADIKSTDDKMADIESAGGEITDNESTGEGAVNGEDIGEVSEDREGSGVD